MTTPPPDDEKKEEPSKGEIHNILYVNLLRGGVNAEIAQKLRDYFEYLEEKLSRSEAENSRKKTKMEAEDEWHDVIIELVATRLDEVMKRARGKVKNALLQTSELTVCKRAIAEDDLQQIVTDVKEGK